MPLAGSIGAAISLFMLFVSSAMAEYPSTGLPVDGRGGYLWNTSIIFPVYPSPTQQHGGYSNTTWATLDGYFNKNDQVNATAGICFGVCLLALLNIVALTPRSKRGLPLYPFTLVALATLAARYLTLMVMYSALEVGSAYYNIAGDYADGETVQSIVGIVFVVWLPPFAFLFVVLCFYVQGKCVLVLMAMKHRYVYNGIMSYLLVLSICTIAVRIVYASFVTVIQFDPTFSISDWMNIAVLATYTATILSWCLVFSWQVGLCIFNRYKMEAPIDKNEGMTILFMTSIESMLIPMIFTVLQLCHISWFREAEFLIMPSVACIIPFGSIWASAANQHATLQQANHMTVACSICTNCSELLSNGTTTASNSSRIGDTNAINISVLSPPPTNIRVLENHSRKFEQNNSGPSGTTTLNITNHTNNILATKPITGEILRTTTASTAEIYPSSPLAPNTPTPTS